MSANKMSFIRFGDFVQPPNTGVLNWQRCQSTPIVRWDDGIFPWQPWPYSYVVMPMPTQKPFLTKAEIDAAYARMSTAPSLWRLVKDNPQTMGAGYQAAQLDKQTVALPSPEPEPKPKRDPFDPRNWGIS